MTWEQVPGHVSASEAHGETTLVVERDSLVEACEHLRDEHGFNFLSDITPTDYLGWGDAGVSGYIGTATGRDLNEADDAGIPAPAAAEAQALRDELPPARAAPRRRAHSPRPGLARRRRERAVASSACGRPPTGTSGRRGT